MSNNINVPPKAMANYPILQSRFCNLNKIELQYLNTISHVVEDAIVIPRDITKLTNFLYLGDFGNAVDVESLKSKGITHIINTVEGNYENCKTGPDFYGTGYTYFGFSSYDEDSYDIMKHFDEVFEFIEEAKKSGGVCLIHCMAGINRSGCLATAYVMIDQNIGPISAVKQVLKKRGMLLTNKGFAERLVKFAKDKNLLEKDRDQILPRFSTGSS